MTDPMIIHESTRIDGKRVHRTRPMTAEERAERLADEDAWEAQRVSAETVESGERTKADRALAVLDAIENGTAGEALAALRIAVPWLVRRELRE